MKTRIQVEWLNNVESINSEYLISPSLVADIWTKMNMDVDNCLDSHSGHKPKEDVLHNIEPFSLKSLFSPGYRVRPKEFYQIYGRYMGDYRNHNIEFYALTFSKEQELELYEGLELVEVSLESFIQAFYLLFELPKFHAFWHGRYGLDYDFIFNDKDMRRATRLAHEYNSEFGKGAFNKGITVRKTDKSQYEVSCYCYGMCGAILKKRMLVTDHTVETLEDVEVLKGGLYFY